MNEKVQRRARIVHVLVDNPSWILPYAEALTAIAAERGARAQLFRAASDLPGGDILFMIGCTKLVPQSVLEKYTYPLVVHESALPAGRGFSPVQWQILEGAAEIPVCLIRAVAEADCGEVYLRDSFHLNGTELNDEWRSMQGEATLRICSAFLDADPSPEAEQQIGEASIYPRRRAQDSQLDPEKSIADQFDLLRVVDNLNYPAFFEFRGQRYELLIRKQDRD